MNDNLMIRIGAYDISIVADPQLLRSGHMGEIDTMHLVLRILPGLPDAMTLRVILHEAIHGILDNAGVNDHDERSIDAISSGLVQIFRDNPWLVALIASSEGAKESEQENQKRSRSAA